MQLFIWLSLNARNLGISYVAERAFALLMLYVCFWERTVYRIRKYAGHRYIRQ